MTKRLSSLLIVCIAAVNLAFGQSLTPTMRAMSDGTPAPAATNVGQTKGKLNLPQSSIYSVAPSKLFEWVAANGNHMQRISQQVMRRIGAKACFPNDPYIYTVLSSTYQTENEGYAQGQVLGIYLNEKSEVYHEMGGKQLPAGDFGSRLAYVRVADKWYTFASQKAYVHDAATGEQLKEVDTDVANAGRGATYDYNRNKFYVINFDGLIEIDGDTFESTKLGMLDGGFVCCLAAAPDGNIYYITYAGQLYKYDYAAKTCSQVLDKVKVQDVDGKDINWQNQGMCAAFDWVSGLMYYCFIDNNWTDHLVCIDTTGSNAPVNVYNYPGRELTMMGLYFANPAKAAPAPAKNIALEGTTLTFTAPSQTVDGDALTGALTAYITVNGEETSYDVVAGETKSLELDLNGNVAITIEIGNSAGRSAERRVMTYVTPIKVGQSNDPYIYTVLSSTYQTENEGYAQGQVLGIYLNEKSEVYHEMGGKQLPAGDYGSRLAYVRVADKWYTFASQKAYVHDATTGELLKEVDTDVANAGRGATYDYNKNKFYVVNFDGIVEINAETLQSEHVYTTSDLGGSEWAFAGGFVTALAAGPDGLYYITYNGNLYKVDLEAGTATETISNLKVLNWQNQGMCAAFDWTTGLLYYAYIDNDWTDHIVRVDLSGAQEPAHVYNYPGRELTMMGLYFPNPAKAAPAPAENISFTGDNLSFTVPTVTVDGSALQADGLKAYVTTNGTEVEYDVTPGQTLSIDHSLTGTIVITIEIGNSAGRSAERRVNAYIGNDLPTHVTNLVLSADDGENMNLTWDAPTASQNGGPIDDSSLNYTVTRMPDEVVVAEGLKTTSFTEPVPLRRDRYYYIVDVYAGTSFGDTWQSNTISAGGEYEVPFVEQFFDQSDFDMWTVIDKNGDGNSWHLQMPWGAESGYMWLSGNGVTNPETGYVSTYDDDYVISLPMQLKKGVDYRLRYDVLNVTIPSETMEVLLGTGQSLTGSEQTLVETYELGGEDHSESHIFNVAEDGRYTLIFHVNTVGNSVNVCIDNVGVDVYSSFEGPGPVTDATVQAGAMGALTNTLSFTAPTVTYKGEALQTLSRIEIYRNGDKKPAKVFENPAVGESLTWIDEDVENGFVEYRILPFNENGQGEEVCTKNWVGLDIPANVEIVKYYMDENQKANVEWKPVGNVGAHGGYVDPAGVKYTLHRYDEWNWSDHWPAVTEPTQDTKAVDADFEIYYGQQYTTYIVVSSNEAGSSSGSEFSIVLGEPYATPYTESFPYKYASQDPWTRKAENYIYAWELVDGSGMTVKPYDSDNGMLRFRYINEESCSQRIEGPRVSLTALTAPELSFYLYHGFEAEPGELALDVYTNTDDEGWVKAASVDYNNGVDGWGRYALPLRAGANNVQIAFGATAIDASAPLLVDCIRIDELVGIDAALTSVSGQKRVEAGDDAELTISVANYGAETLSDYKLTVSMEGQTLEPFAADELVDIEPNGVENFTFTWPVDRSRESQYIVFTAEVQTEGDEQADNNSRDFKLYIHNSNLPEPQNLTGETADGTVTLAWQKPATDEMPDEVTDGFDEYDSFVIEGFGDWKTYDGDGQPTTYFGGPEIPHQFEAKAWQVWAPEEAGFSLERFDVLTPVSGDKLLACWAASDGYSSTLPQDDWLISSDVLGGSDLSFWYRVPNDGSDAQVFEILYSTTDDDVENFQVLDRDSVVGTTDWVQFLYTLPKEAKFFAIRNCSYGSYNVAFIDDIVYTPLYSSMTKLTLQGYNVYRDNELLAENVSQTAYEDMTAGSDAHTYHVTAVYAEGESRYSNAYDNAATVGIADMQQDGLISISAADHAIRIAGADGLISIYTVDGKRVFAASSRATLTVRVMPGVYVVNAGGVIRKLTVK